MNAEDKRHGTDAGYRQHRRDGDMPCAACRKGAADRRREARQREAEEEVIELSGGAWVPGRHGVLRWVEYADAS